MLLALLSVACLPAEDTPTPSTDTAVYDASADWVAGAGPMASVSGQAFVFGPAPEDLSLTGATVYAVEAPEHSTTVGEGGTFALEVPSGAPLTFRVTQDGFAAVDSAAIFIEPDGLTLLGFQVPADTVVSALALAAGIEMSDERCQIATTVSSEASPPYGAAGVGEPGATAAIAPALPDDAVGPVYFDYLSESLILPAPDLSATTIDGGVLWGNVPPGEYVISAEKEGTSFTAPVIRCRAGTLVNASPPYGIEFDGND